MAARLAAFRRLAFLHCQDWHRADDLVQATITRLYVHWARASAVDHSLLGPKPAAWVTDPPG